MVSSSEPLSVSWVSVTEPLCTANSVVQSACGQPSVSARAGPNAAESQSACLPPINTKSAPSSATIFWYTRACVSGSRSVSVTTCTARSAPRARAVRIASSYRSGPTDTATISASVPFSRMRMASSTPYSSMPSITNVTPPNSTAPPVAVTRASASGTCLRMVMIFILLFLSCGIAAWLLLKYVARNYYALNFVRTFVNLVQLHVAHELLHRVFIHVAVATKYINRFLRGVKRHVGRVRFRNCSSLAVWPAAVGRPSGVPRLPARGFHPNFHVRQLKLDRLELPNGAAERLAFVGIGNAFVE